MKREVPKSENKLHLDNPSIIESKPSIAMQFLFYFIFLILGVSGVYGCFYTTFSLPISLQVFISYAVLFCAVFTMAFLIKTRHILLLFLALTVAVVFFLKGSLMEALINHITQGYFLTYNAVISAYAQKKQYSLFTFPTAVANSNEITAAITMFAVFSLFILTLLMAYMLIQRKNTTVCFLLTAPFLGISVVLGIMPHYAAVGSLYIFWAFLILNSSFLRNKNKFNKKKGVFYSGGKISANPQSLIFLPLLVACLMLVTVLFPINSFKRSDVVKDMRINLLNVPEIPSPIQIPIQSVLGYAERVNLQLVGNITFTGKTVLRVKSSSNENDYLKGFVGSIYTGQSWDSLPDKEYEKLDALLDEWKVQNFSSHFNKLLGRTSKAYDLDIQNVKRNSLRVYVPYGLVSKPEELPGIDFINDGFLRSSNVIFGTNEYSLKATTQHIDAWKMSEPMMNAFVSEQSSFVHAAKEYKNFVYSHYTQLPEALEERLKQYLHDHNLNIEYYLTPNAFANAIITQVQSENSYTLSPGLTPEGQDFIEYFLFENHKGYCVHFASATVALLRSAGVPARYVEGYAVSPDDFEEYDGWASIPDSRSHAWVEIYLGAVGWVPVEATPGSNRGIIDHEAAEAETSSYSNPLEDEATNDKFYDHEILQIEDLPDVEGSESSSSEMQSSNTSSLMNNIIRILPILPVSGLLITALIIRRKLQIAMRKKQFTQKDSNKAAIAVYNYIVKLYAYAKSNGTADTRIPKDLYALVLKARFSQHMLSEQELESLIAFAESQALEIQKAVKLFKSLVGKYLYVLF